MGCQTLLIVLATLLFYCDGQLSRERVLQNSIKARKLPQLDKCGQSGSPFDTKIINGKPAELGAYPWMANLGYVDRPNQSPVWMCAGSLITNRYILTAAHCIDPRSIQTRRRWTLSVVRLGELDLNDTVPDGANPVDYEVETYVFHEEYDSHKKTNDIGLVRTKQEIVFTGMIKPICLPPPEFYTNDFVGFTPAVAGWGKSVDAYTKAGTRLLEVEVEIKERSDCKTNITSMLSQAVIDKRVICAASPGKDSCQGDSGGPLMLQRRLKGSPPGSTGNIFLMGVVSYGWGCAEEGYPGVYTRVTEFMPWVIDKMDM